MPLFMMLLVLSCPAEKEKDNGNDINNDTRKELVAGQMVQASKDDTTAIVTFSGAENLSLTADDFKVVSGDSAVILDADVDGSIVTLMIIFNANTTFAARQYIIGINPESKLIKGDAIVTINHAPETDTRALLTAGASVNALAEAVTANVTFSGASGLSLTSEDFAVISGDANITLVFVSGNTATVRINFAANNTTDVREYIIGINSDSEKIRGNTIVEVIHDALPDTRILLTAGSGVNAAYGAVTASVTFNGATGLILSDADFIVTGEANIFNTYVIGSTATVIINFSANNSNTIREYVVGINPSSEKIMGNSTVTVTHAANPRIELTAGLPMIVGNDAASAVVTFSGDAAGLALTSADFVVTGTGVTIGNIDVSGGTAALVTVNFPVNDTGTQRNYVIGINPASEKIRGSTTAVITHLAVIDNRVDLSAGTPVTALRTAASANVTFNGALGLSPGLSPGLILSGADFTVVSGNASIGNTVNVTGDTATVTVNFPVNNSYIPREYIIGIASNSDKIKGGAQVIITHEAKPALPSLFESNLTWGITYTQYRWDSSGNATARSRAEAILRDVSTIYNIHIMGWGTGNPWPTRSGSYNFNDIRNRVNTTIRLGGEPWITFCQAPGWMKVANYDNLNANQKNAADWNMDLAPLAQFEDDFATLCAAIAQAFPDVKVFQVWNEFKGMWNGSVLDHVRYTRLYNKVYTAVKAVRPDAVIGGFYHVMEGDGIRATFGNSVNGWSVPNNIHTSEPLHSTERTAIQYFINNAIAFDLFLVDRANVDYHNDGYFQNSPGVFRPTRDQAMQLTKYFRKATADIAALTAKPIVWSEYYGTYGDGTNTGNGAQFMPINSQYIGAHYASIIYNMIMGAGGRDLYALLWLEAENDIRHAIFTDVANSTGGQATPHYHAMKKILDNFPKGTMLYTANLSIPGVAQNLVPDRAEALVSEKVALIINKTNSNLSVILNDETYQLSPYAVEVFDLGENP